MGQNNFFIRSSIMNAANERNFELSEPVDAPQRVPRIPMSYEMISLKPRIGSHCLSYACSCEPKTSKGSSTVVFVLETSLDLLIVSSDSAS